MNDIFEPLKKLPEYKKYFNPVIFIKLFMASLLLDFLIPKDFVLTIFRIEQIYFLVACYLLTLFLGITILFVEVNQILNTLLNLKSLDFKRTGTNLFISLIVALTIISILFIASFFVTSFGFGLLVPLIIGFSAIIQLAKTLKTKQIQLEEFGKTFKHLDDSLILALLLALICVPLRLSHLIGLTLTWSFGLPWYYQAANYFVHLGFFYQLYSIWINESSDLRLS